MENPYHDFGPYTTSQILQSQHELRAAALECWQSFAIFKGMAALLFGISIWVLTFGLSFYTDVSGWDVYASEVGLVFFLGGPVWILVCMCFQRLPFWVDPRKL